MNSLVRIFFVIFLSGCFAQPTPDKPLIFHLESATGLKSCLIALSHMVEIPATESINILDCEKQAQALVLEMDPNSLPENFWSIYTIKEKDLQIANLSQNTIEKIVPALKASQYSDAEIKYFLTLHPVAIYRALTYSKSMAPTRKLHPNIDMQIAKIASEKKFQIVEIEGMSAYAEMEKLLTVDKVDFLISHMCDLILSKELTENYLKKVNNYTKNLSSQPDIDTAWNKKLYFNLEILNLPAYTIWHDVDSRNINMAKNILKIVNADKQVLIFVGSAHVGGANSVLKILETNGLKIIRVQ
jgi:uncharacterized protein YbaP (TraB family)